MTIGNIFFIPGLIHYLWSHYKGCHICQLSRNDKLPTRQLQTRINSNYMPLSRLGMDLNIMLRSYKGHKYILCIIDEVKKYLITVLIHQSRSEKIGEALIENEISKYCVPEYIIMDQDSTFISSLINYLFKKLDIKIKSLSTVLTKHLTNLCQMWPKYLPLAIFTYNTFNTPNLANYTPYKLVFSRKPKLLLYLETTPDIKA